MKRRIAFVALLTALVLALCGALVGCKKKKDPVPTDGITLGSYAMTLTAGETAEISATVPGGGQVTWSSADPAVATVTPNGDGTATIAAVAEGKTKVTAQSGSMKAECSVTVVPETEQAVLVLKEVEGDSVNLNLTYNTYRIGAAVYFKGEEQSGATFEYASEDESIATVSADGLITALKTGQTEVTVSAAWDKFDKETLTRRIRVNVVKRFTFTLDVPEGELYGLSSLDGDEYTNTVQVTPNLVIEGDAIETGFTYASSDDSIASVDGSGTVTGHKAGSVTITATYTDPEDQVPYSTGKTVEVSYIVRDKDLGAKQLLDVRALNAEEFLDIFEDGKSIDRIVEGATTYTVAADGTMTTAQEVSATGENKTFTIYNEVYAYNVTVDIAYVVSDYADFAETLLAAETANSADLIVLDADLTSDGTAFEGGSDGKNFSGILDGRGHSIAGMNLANEGLIYALDGTVKNIALVECEAENGTLLCNNLNGTVSNVFVSGSAKGSAIAGAIGEGFRLENTIAFVSLSVADSAGNRGALIEFGAGSMAAGHNDCYAICTNRTGLCTDTAWAAGEHPDHVAKNEVAFFAMVSSLPESYNACGYWSLDGEGLKFGEKIMIRKPEELPEATARLPSLVKDAGDAYAEENIKNGFFEIALTSGNAAALSGLSKATIGGMEIDGYELSDNTLKIPVTAVSALAVSGEDGILCSVPGHLYNLPVVVVDYVVETYEKFTEAITASRKTSKWIYLNSDIEADDDLFTGAVNGDNFGGMLDGRGHSVTGMKLDGTGLFYSMSGTIKNIALVDFTGGDSGSIVCNSVASTGTVSNVFVSGTTGLSAIATGASEGCTITNVIVNIQCTGTDTDGNLGAIVNMAWGTVPSHGDCYAIANRNGLFSTAQYTAKDGDRVVKDDVGFFEMVPVLPSSYQACGYWTLDGDGLKFGDTLVIKRPQQIPGVAAALAVLGKDTTTYAEYAAKYVDGGYYKITLPAEAAEALATATGLRIGLTPIEDFTIAEGVLKISVAEIAELASGDMSAVFTGPDDLLLSAKVVVADCAVETYAEFKTAMQALEQQTASATGKWLALANDLTADGEQFTVGGAAFYGVLDGAGHTIENMTFATSLCGDNLYGTIQNIAFVNCTAENGNVICGTLYGTVSNVFISGSAKGAAVASAVQENWAVKNVIVEVTLSQADTDGNRGAILELCAGAFDGGHNDCYGICTNRTGLCANSNWAGASHPDHVAQNAAGFFEKVSSLPATYNGYWSLDEDGLKFGGKVVISKE